MLHSVTLVDVDEHIVQEVDGGQDDFTLIQLTYMLDRVIVKVAFYRLDLIVEHESVDEERTDLTEEDRRYVLRILCCEVKEDTLLTSLSGEDRKSAVELSVGVSGLSISVYLIDEEYERTDIVT